MAGCPHVHKAPLRCNVSPNPHPFFLAPFLPVPLRCREARVMDTIAEHLAPLHRRLAIPRSVGGLVTQRLMVMTFVEVGWQSSSEAK